MREFPRAVFTAPGPNACQGGSYGSELVRDEKEMKAALEAGFFETLPEALEAEKAAKAPKAEAPKPALAKEPKTPKGE